MKQSRYVYYNPNPFNNICSDCVVRALSIAFQSEWDDIYKHLCELGFSLKLMPNDKDCYKTFLANTGFQRTGISNKKGSKRPTVDSFAAEHPSGVYVLEVAHHIVTVKDGKYYDVWNSGSKSLYGYWSKKSLSAELRS